MVMGGPFFIDDLSTNNLKGGTAHSSAILFNCQRQGDWNFLTGLEILPVAGQLPLLPTGKRYP
jgi:hypothetical protein